MEVESVEGVVRILLEHYYKVLNLGAKRASSILLLVLFFWVWMWHRESQASVLLAQLPVLLEPLSEESE